MRWSRLTQLASLYNNEEHPIVGISSTDLNLRLADKTVVGYFPSHKIWGRSYLFSEEIGTEFLRYTEISRYFSILLE